MAGELVPDSTLRMSTADREQLVERLNIAVGEGRITLEEFEERMTGVLAAKTFGEIVPFFEGLPTPVTSPSAPVPVTDLVVKGSSLRRNGRWVVPPRMRIEAHGSSVRLDYTEAVIPTRVVEVEVIARGSSTRLIVPPGSSVDMGGVSLHGGSAKSRRLGDTPVGGGVHFVVTGQAKGSSIVAKPPRTWRWPWERRRRSSF